MQIILQKTLISLIHSVNIAFSHQTKETRAFYSFSLHRRVKLLANCEFFDKTRFATIIKAAKCKIKIMQPCNQGKNSEI